jgi:hypothetical protein
MYYSNGRQKAVLRIRFFNLDEKIDLNDFPEPDAVSFSFFFFLVGGSKLIGAGG